MEKEIIIKAIKNEYECKNKEKITLSNRCLYAKQNETLNESKCRHSGFLSGLLVAIQIIEKLEV